MEEGDAQIEHLTSWGKAPPGGLGPSRIEDSGNKFGAL